MKVWRNYQAQDLILNVVNFQKPYIKSSVTSTLNNIKMQNATKF